MIHGKSFLILIQNLPRHSSFHPHFSTCQPMFHWSRFFLARPFYESQDFELSPYNNNNKFYPHVYILFRSARPLYYPNYFIPHHHIHCCSIVSVTSLTFFFLPRSSRTGLLFPAIIFTSFFSINLRDAAVIVVLVSSYLLLYESGLMSQWLLEQAPFKLVNLNEHGKNWISSGEFFAQKKKPENQ